MKNALVIITVAFLFCATLMAGMVIAQTSPKQTDGTSNWQRMKECAEQAERSIKSLGQPEGPYTSRLWESHYSRKYNRCYVKIPYFWSGEKKGNDSNAPYGYDELYDAFEQKLLSQCLPFGRPDSAYNFYCGITDEDGSLGVVDCDVCREYIKDRMKN